jgi:hypothetical protein
MLKHNTAKKNKRTLFFFGWYIDECTNNVSERNKVLFSKEEEMFRKMGKKNSSIVVWTHRMVVIG